MKKQTYKWIETWIFTLTMNVFAFTFAHGYFHEFGMLGLQPFLGMHILLVCRCQSCRPKAVAERFCRAAMWSGWRGRCFHSTGSKHGVSWWHVLNIARPNCLPSNRLRSLRRCSTFTLDFKTSRFVGCSQVLGSVWLSLPFSGMWPVFATSWVRRSPCEHVARCALRTSFSVSNPGPEFPRSWTSGVLVEGWKDEWLFHVIPHGNVQRTQGHKGKVHFWLLAGWLQYF